MLDADTIEQTGELAGVMRAAAFGDPRDIPTRFTLLKQMAECPAKYLDACQRDQDDSLASRLGGATHARDRKEMYRFGTAVHAFTFETGEVAVFTGARRAGKEWDAFRADAADRGCVEILNVRENALALEVSAAIRRNKTAMRLLDEDAVEREKRIDWEWLTKACRSTPDARGRTYIVDLKTTQSANPTLFVRQGARLYYHCQAALYRRAVEAAGHPAPSDAYVIAVEKSPPYPVTVMRFVEDTLDLGDRMTRLWMERLLQCEVANAWPEYSAAIVDFAIDADASPFVVEIDGEKIEA